MDRGWRRSGTLLYLPDVSRSCCPHYTIRLPAAEFHPGRDQRHAINRWNRFVLGEKYLQEVAKRYPKTKVEKKRDSHTFDLLAAIHASEISNLKPDVEPEHRFEVTLEADTLTEEKFALFDNYQRHVHHEDDDDISRAGFKRFLCSSPLHRHTTPTTGQKLGSYHQCYRLDGRLIAMGVLDLLPHGVSGVYFLYHSDFEKWSFGKLSALRETALALEGGYGHYYMGYYIHSCKKMRYKGDYHPQYVLDLHSLEWDLLDENMKILMEKRKYASMSRERERLMRKEQCVAGTTNRPDEHGKSPVLPPAPNETPQDVDKNDLTQSGDPTEENDVSYPKPLDAHLSGLSLLELGMPGVMTLDQLQQADFDLSLMKVTLGKSTIHEMQDIVSWDAGSETDVKTIKGMIAEFVATVGPDIAKNVIINFGTG